MFQRRRRIEDRPAARFAEKAGRAEDAATVLTRCMAETKRRLAAANDPILKARLGKFDLCRNDFAGGEAARATPRGICRGCLWRG